MNQVPDISNCFRLMEEFAMLPNIRRHSIVVARVGLRIVDGLRKNETVRPSVPGDGLIAAGALLHDIAKTPCLKNGCDHARAGAEICRNLGYPEIAVIVEEHVLLKEHNFLRYRTGVFTAAEIIYYADKRVRHEEIVSLEDRLEYILEHYGMSSRERHRLIRENFDRCVRLEQELFRFLPFSPDRMSEEVHTSSSDTLLTMKNS
jgi:putative nucleotidyltransferase with HDIG domain